ncbi:MAG: hypothetical protein M1822_008092 [Bathelium mastoideum]|nr:MAG: hypothetical protein M1822_008092 [Bathelium mastoideum]
MATKVLRNSDLAHRIFEPDHEEYSECLKSYWSKQETEVRAQGVFKPQNATQVATAVKLLHEANVGDGYSAPFAIRSGGHQAFPGSANIESGLVIDIRLIKNVSINSDKSLVTVGAGASFEDVYKFLEPMGLNIPGARVAQVGVSGFTLGGGISYYSPRYGFVCDNVDQFEIVIADGSILKANASEHTDLWKALKGGGNNFGVVTSITFRTIKKQDLWGGAIMNNASDFNNALQSMHRQISSPRFDCNAAIMLGICHLKGMGRLAYGSLKYTEPVENPAVMQDFTVLPALHSSMRISSLAELTIEEGKYSAGGERRLYMNCCFRSNQVMLADLQGIWEKTLETVSNIAGIEWSFILNPIVPAAITEGNARGGNVLGLTADEPVIVVLLVGTWDNGEDDTSVVKAGWQAIDEISARAKELGVFHPYIYMNYAWKDQDVISGYGTDTKLWLQRLSKIYDPDGIFQRAVPGGFKLFS